MRRLIILTTITLTTVLTAGSAQTIFTPCKIGARLWPVVRIEVNNKGVNATIVYRPSPRFTKDNVVGESRE